MPQRTPLGSLFITLTVLFLCASCCHCPQAQPSTREAEKSRDLPTVQAKYAVVKVFYGTNRNVTGQAKPNNFYGSAAGEFQYETCDVSIPRDHRMGELERPSILQLDFTEDPARHVVVLAVNPLDSASFFNQVGGRVDKSSEKQLLVFVHGFDNSFADAAQRTAQLTSDLGYDGAPIFYSWPSAVGHSYYAENPSVLADLADLILAIAGKDITARPNLEKVALTGAAAGLAYWRFFPMVTPPPPPAPLIP